MAPTGPAPYPAPATTAALPASGAANGSDVTAGWGTLLQSRRSGLVGAWGVWGYPPPRLSAVREVPGMDEDTSPGGFTRGKARAWRCACLYVRVWARTAALAPERGPPARWGDPKKAPRVQPLTPGIPSPVHIWARIQLCPHICSPSQPEPPPALPWTGPPRPAGQGRKKGTRVGGSGRVPRGRAGRQLGAAHAEGAFPWSERKAALV